MVSRHSHFQTTTILVAGMKAATTYHMQGGGTSSMLDSTNTFSSEDLTFTTGPLPGTQMPTASSSPRFPGISVTLPTPGLTPSPGVELLSLTSDGPQSVVARSSGQRHLVLPRHAETGQPLAKRHFIIVRPLDLQESRPGTATLFRGCFVH